MAQADSPVWTTNSNDALHISLVRAKEEKDVLAAGESYEDFHPSFTYPIFGEEEKIYGYQDLRIDFKFSSGSLRQYLSVKHSASLPKTADDIEGTLYKFIPSDYLKSESGFLQCVEEDAVSFRPFGEKIASYTRSAPGIGKGKNRAHDPVEEESENAVVYEVYHATMATPGFRDYHRRMQIFILLYIEAGSYIQEDDDRWEFMLLFERRRRKDASFVYHFVGYSSLYPFWCWPDKVRLRLSQFVIITPYQRYGLGSDLYNAIYNFLVSRNDVLELTIEDPAEAFEDLRDKNDLRMLLSNENFMREASGTSHERLGKPGLGPPAEKAWVEKWRLKMKIAKRQFQRLVEMLILRSLQPLDTKANRAFRLQVKERLYRFNFDALVQLDKEERLEKLETTYQNVREGYREILERV